MIKSLIVLGAAAVAFTAVPAAARPHHMACAKMRHGHCAVWARGYTIGYRFGPSYAYTDYSALPRPYVTRYHLNDNYRYVRTGNTIYVVDPTTYAVTRVLNGIR